jgi:hypothetical protein
MPEAYLSSTSNPSRRACSISSSEGWIFAGSVMVVSLSCGMTARTVAGAPPGKRARSVFRPPARSAVSASASIRKRIS